MISDYFDLEQYWKYSQSKIKEQLLRFCDKITTNAQQIYPLLKDFIENKCSKNTHQVLEDPLAYLKSIIELADYIIDIFKEKGFSIDEDFKAKFLENTFETLLDAIKNYTDLIGSKFEEIKSILDKLYDGILIIDANTHQILAANKAMEDILQKKPLSKINVFELLNEDKKAYYQDLFLQFINKQKGITEPLEFKTSSNTIVYLEASVSLLNSQTMIAVFRDITKRLENEKLLVRINRLYEVLSRINNTMIRVQSINDLFKSVCEILVTFGHFKLAWIGCVDEKTKMVKPKAYAGEKRYLKNIVVSVREDLPEGQGPSGVAIRENKIVVCNNILTSPQMSPWRERAKASGFHSSITVPISLFETNTVSKVLKVYSDEIDSFDKEEIKLFEEIASDISYAINFLEKKQQVSYLSSFDVLTNLPNRISFAYTIDTLIKTKRHFALLICDINNFTALNNKYGYIKADIVLKTIAKILLSLPNIHYVARTGNDEFGIILDFTDETKITKFAIDLNEYVQKTNFDVDFAINLTFGACLWPQNAKNTQELIANTEIALLQAKKLKRFINFYSEEANKQIQQAISYQNKIKAAIKKGEFVLFYQPKLSLKDFCIKSCEALLRWQTNDKILLPKDFIGTLEETKLICELGLKVFEQALKQIDKWQKSHFNVSVAINVSAVQLEDDDFVQNILGLISKYKTPLNLIEIEITESVLIQHLDKLTTLHEHGLSIVIDDFGTGYSSLSYLQSIPVSGIKIDMVFIQKMFEGKNLEILKTIIDLAKVLNLKTTAEGIETKQQLEAIVKLGCDEAQGFLIGFPQPPQNIEPLFKETFHHLL